MVVCPNCNHQNPDGAVQCEACYTPLPAVIACPNCGTSVQADASFCGQCGFNLRSVAAKPPMSSMPNSQPNPDLDPIVPDPLVAPEPISILNTSEGVALPPPEEPERSAPPVPHPLGNDPTPPQPISAPNVGSNQTQLQFLSARLLNLQTNAIVEIPAGLTVVHIGKPNDRIPPDIDVSGFPNSEIVSRIHADIRVEGDAYYIEDVGSSNGTYVNNSPLSMGNRHRLRSGDRIAFGKGDKVSFLFQM